MKVLVAGGTGMIGSHAARHLRECGHDITVGARNAPSAESLVADFPVLIGDYTRDEITERELAGFDAVVFAAGNDIRHVPPGADIDEFWDSTQSVGVPRFMERAKHAGVRRAIQIGSYYHQVMPELVDRDAYVRARSRADERARALADDGFNVCTLNPPSIVGAIPGIATRRYAKMVRWADGDLPNVPDFAPAGGTNYLSVRSLAQAIAGALHGGAAGHAYLIGDQNLTFREFFQMLFDVAGSTRQLAERDEAHPFLPDAVIVPGRGTVLSYQPDPDETVLLGYQRGDVRRALEGIVATVRRTS